jgi:cysteine desulfurase
MKAPIFFDQTHSYHPLTQVTEILRKSIHPHALSGMHSKEAFLQQTAYLDKIRQYLGIDQNSFFYLSAGGDAALDYMLDHFYLQEMFHSGKQQVLISSVDEGLLGRRLNQLKTLGVMSQLVKVNGKGHLTEEILKNTLNPRTALLSLSWAHPLTGIIQPVADIVEACHARGVFCHVDASHVIGKLYFNLADLGIDYVTFDAQAFHGPYSVGGLISSNKRFFQDPGSPLPLQLEALASSLAHASGHIDEMHLEVARLRQSFEQQIVSQIPKAQVLLQDRERLPHISVLSFPYVHHEYFLYLLKQDQLYASIGSANQSLATILQAMHIESALAQCALSFSLSHQTKQEEIDQAVETIVKRYHQAEKLVEKVYV